MKLKAGLAFVWLIITVIIFLAVNQLQSSETHPQMVYVNFAWTEFIFSVFAISTYAYLIANSERACAHFDSWFYGILSLYAGVSIGVLLLNALISVDYKNRTWIGAVFLMFFLMFIGALIIIYIAKMRFIKKELELNAVTTTASLAGNNATIDVAIDTTSENLENFL